MVQAMINIDERANRVINIVKAKYGVRDKSQAINILARQFEKKLLEPKLRPEYLKKLNKLEKEKGIPFKDIKELRKIIEG